MRPGRLNIAMVLTLCVLAAAEDTVLREAPVPNRLLKQGTAKLFRRGDAVGVRIDLQTRHLERVIAKVVESEETHWPGHAGSAAYRRALKELSTTVLDNQSGKPRFTIDWVLHPDGTGAVRLGNDLYRRELTDLPPEYLRENLLLILQDRFDLSESEAEAILTSDL